MSAREVRVCDIWVKPLSLSWISGLPGRHPSRLWQQDHGASSPLWSFLHGGHTTPVFLILFTASCSWGEVLGECGQEMGISSAHAPPPHLCKKVSTLRSGRGWETDSKVDNLIFLPQEMNFICKSVRKCSKLRIVSRTVEVVVKGSWGVGGFLVLMKIQPTLYSLKDRTL